MIIPSLNIVPKIDINGPNARLYDQRETIFVSPNGKDNYLGSKKNTPVKSLSGVKILTNRMKTGNPRSLKIEFLSGSYDPEHIFFNSDKKYVYFKHDEGGSDDYELIFKAENKNERPVFRNDKTYTGFVSSGEHWKVEIDEKDVRKCNLFGFVNGIRSVPARFPKYGALPPESDTIHIYNGEYFRKVKDSGSFMATSFSYLTSGGDSRKLGVMYSKDFQTFGRTNVMSISTSLPDSAYEEGIYYISVPNNTNANINTGSWQIFANQSYLFDPTVGSYQEYQYKPSNLPAISVCTTKGENTIIEENGGYFFYYKPSERDISIGMDNSKLTTFKHGNPDIWTTSALYKNNAAPYDKVSKTSAGYSYSEGDDPDNSNHVGFYFVNPTNLKFQDLDFEYCVCPMTFNTPVSSDQFNDLDDGLLKEFTHGVSISGCNLKYSFGCGIAGRFINDIDVYKNLIYSTESGGIQFAGGMNLKINNNIVKSFQMVDTRKSENAGQGGIKVLGTRNKAETLSSVSIENNDCGYGGNVVDTIAGSKISITNNKFYNAGFGTNSDMAVFYQGFSYTSDPKDENLLRNNIIKNARAYRNIDFLGNLIYCDGGTRNLRIHDNLIYNGQTGIKHASQELSPVYNNIIYDTKYASIISKSNITARIFPKDIRYWGNIIVTGKNNQGSPSWVSRGWLGTAYSTRTISNSPPNIKMVDGNGATAKSLKAISTWNGRIYYMSVQVGGPSTVVPPTALYNGTDWVIGIRNINVGTPEDGVLYILSASNSSQYQNIWDVPEDNWNYVNSYSSIYSFFDNFSKVEMDGTFRENTMTIPMSSNNNLFWSMADSVSTPEDDVNFFIYNDSITTFDQITSYAIPGNPRSGNDNSLLSAFGECVLIEQDSVLGDPLFIDAENEDFRLSEFSPASSINFEEVDFSGVGVYNTPDDQSWELSAVSFIPQPVIFGHKEWASYTTHPFPFEALMEYDIPQHD